MIEIPSTGVPIKAWIEGVPLEAEARTQLQNIDWMLSELEAQ